MSVEIPSGAPVYELDDGAPDYTPLADKAAAFRARLPYAARGRYGNLTRAGQLLIAHGNAARRVLHDAGGDDTVDGLLALAGVTALGV